MTNEFDGTESDQAWVALTANDPARQAPNPDLDAIKTLMFSDAAKVAPISKRSWFAPVAVAASVALFVGGGAGYTIAAQSTSDSSTSIAALAPEMGAPTGSGVGGANGSAVGMPSGAQDSKLALSAPAGWEGRRPYLKAGSDVSDESGKQVGYTFDASNVDRKTQIVLIADTFGIRGKITGSKKDGYFVGDNNYVKAVAQVSGASWDLSQLITWNYGDSSVYPTYCGGDMPMYDTKSSSGSGSTSSDLVTTAPVAPVPAPSKCKQPSGVLPSDESALALAKEKFAALNFESDSAIWSVEDSGSNWGYSPDIAGAYKLVTAKVLVAGIPSNQSWSMDIGPDNAIINATGFFTKFVPTVDYNIVGAKTATERSQNALWSNLQPQLVYKQGIIHQEELALGGNPSVVARNQSGQPVIDAQLDRITISKAETSLMAWYLNDGSTILLPAYLLSESDAADSRQWLQLAIADEYVDFN
jgi:hypothetical protein